MAAVTNEKMHPVGHQGHPQQQQQHQHLQQQSDHSSDDTRNDQGHHDEEDEYGNLLDYVAKVSERKAHPAGVNEDGSYEKKKRVWYAPWKTRTVKYDRNGEVIPHDGAKQTPEDWLETDIQQGLTDAQVEERRKIMGWNELESSKENLFLKFFTFFQGPILYTMELAVILAAGLRDWIDFGVIIAILLLNAFVGWYQEKQAGDVVAKLKADIALKAHVVRNGQEKEIPARDVVPGDIVIIEDGDTIPADGRVVGDYSMRGNAKSKEMLRRVREIKAKKASEKGLGKDDLGDEDDVDKGHAIASADQSAITGESLAVDKHLDDFVFYTTGCKRGKVYMMASETGTNTFVGRTAALVTGDNQKGHFQIVMTSIGTALLVLVVAFGFGFWIGGFFRNIDIATPSENNLLVYTLIFLIIGVPVGLPCVTTTTLAVGAAYLAKRKAIVQKLTAIEALAGVDVLCSDKTGTLTANKLTINEPFCSEGVEPDWLMAVAALASSHAVNSLDPIDKVTIETLARYPKAQEYLRAGWVTKKFTPFDPVSKRIVAEVERDGKSYVACKGAPNAVLKLCQPPQEVADLYRHKAQEFAHRGFRSLGVAFQENGQWELLGIMPMFDPPRSDTASTVAEAGHLGVKVKMLTGDAVAIAIETCKQLNLGTNVYDSERLISGGGMSGSDIHDFVEAADGFGEVYPEHKYQVVTMLQQRGHLTGMTGDGVNDAPSLKRADCGIAVQGATDAARAAADVVFLDEGLSTIITSIKVARQIFARMKAYIEYRIALCLHLEIYLLLSILILNEVIRVDLIVFIALFADVATIAIAYDNAVYAERPVEWQLPKIWIISSILGCLLAAGTWILRGTLFLRGGGVIQNFGNPQGILFLEVSLTENWLIFITRVQTSFTWPSFQLVGAILAVDILATLFCLFGWLVHGGNGSEDIFFGESHHEHWTDIVTVVRVWAYSLGVTIVIALVYFILQKVPYLDNLGRRDRHRVSRQYEDFLVSLQRITIVHEAGQDGGPDHFRFEDKAKALKGEGAHA
ncbi:plasma-membrane proton-e [Cystobasidium minutum MCA 4210]|uniref:plasma-membrane proton-e n=1 Tax=Cystobasidium minutum MCA 4210 TaxID=1397322 RepID=UPI0034CFF6AA|eukprot:jgi/Rhomi1/199781/MIX610_62565_82